MQKGPPAIPSTTTQGNSDQPSPPVTWREVISGDGGGEAVCSTPYETPDRSHVSSPFPPDTTNATFTTAHTLRACLHFRPFPAYPHAPSLPVSLPCLPSCLHSPLAPSRPSVQPPEKYPRVWPGDHQLGATEQRTSLRLDGD
ncbi:hypothetical protein Pmani_034696 [Petrolisthes manimaculis]|uniref:Uncharacterized protein n=1 Tax=Petrolisthes manimaculis TaxID=1843537 RepID=A0AAE1NLZ6_9EUCA|nr:hypothetical protein Pmani_034696 [Petrolisthes manimaculis]